MTINARQLHANVRISQLGKVAANGALANTELRREIFERAALLEAAQRVQKAQRSRCLPYVTASIHAFV